MTRKFEFEVVERSIGPSSHGWEARDKESGVRVPLAAGGDGDLVGSYPELEEYLAKAHGVETRLTFLPSVDEFRYRPGGATWTYRRNAGSLVVTVEDIHRTMFRFTVEWAK